MNTSKIDNDDAEDVERWQVPLLSSMDASSDVSIAESKPVTAKQIENIQKEAYKEAYDVGHKKGFEAGDAKALEQHHANIHALENIVSNLSQPLKVLDGDVEDQLLNLVVLITKQIIRRELKIDQGQIVSVIREAVSLLPLVSRNIDVRIHPEDLNLVMNKLSQESKENQTIKFTADPSLNRGDCYVITESSQINASIESRLNAIIANMLGSERDEDTA